MSCYNYETLEEHVGHDVQCVRYGEDNVTVECHTCHVVIVTHERFPEEEVEPRSRKGIGSGECGTHGEYFLDAHDSPCPACEDEL